MDNKNDSAGLGQGNNFVIGFLLGAVVGAAVVFLLRTKKGKKLLKAISQEGIENISNIIDEAGKTEELDELEVATKSKPEGQKKEFVQKREFAIKERFIEEKPKVRRFFRGISRRVN